MRGSVCVVLLLIENDWALRYDAGADGGSPALCGCSDAARFHWLLIRARLIGKQPRPFPPISV